MMKKIHFKLWPDALCLLLFLGMLGLGFWQLQRAEYKRQLLAQYTAQQQTHSVNLAHAKQNPKQYQYADVQLTGRFDNVHTIVIENQFSQHRLGYYVLSPFHPAQSREILLVNRGWISRENLSFSFAKIKPIDGVVTIQGKIKTPGKNPFVMQPKLTQNWPHVVADINLEYLQKILRQPLYPFILLLDEQDKNGFVREWVVTTMPPERHVGYAVQWFVMAFVFLALLIYYKIRGSRSCGKN